jgi:hypothetical protein
MINNKDAFDVFLTSHQITIAREFLAIFAVSKIKIKIKIDNDVLHVAACLSNVCQLCKKELLRPLGETMFSRYQH